MSYFEATPGLILAEDDVRRLILHDQALSRFRLSALQKWTRALSTVLVLAILSYLVLNAPAMFTKTQFYVQSDVLPQAPEALQGTLPVPGEAVVQSAVVTESKSHSTLADNHLYIKRIKVDAPINWDITNNDSDVLESLKSGVVQLAGTAKPGQLGNVFIVGHSSDYLWSSGHFKHVFTLLPNLKIGDAITIMYNNIQYDYHVSEIKTVAPDDTSVLQSDGTAKLSLMTCVPIGTKAKRLVVIATPTNEALNTQGLPVQNSNSGSLPAAQ